MRRWLFNILAAVSLVLCAFSLILWMRSYLPADLHMGVRDGKLILMFDDGLWSENNRLIDAIRSVRNRNDARWEFMGFEFASRGSLTDNDKRTLLGIPIAYIGLAFAVVPAWWLWRRRQTMDRERQGRCTNCGYDLRASKDKCPECGTAIPPQTAKPQAAIDVARETQP